MSNGRALMARPMGRQPGAAPSFSGWRLPDRVEHGGYPSNLLSRSEAFVPPNPKEFVMAYAIDAPRQTLGT